MRIPCKSAVPGTATADLLYSSVPLSFWGGVDPNTGDVIDHHHPLFGSSIKNKFLALPSSRGSCSGSLVLIELLVNQCAPAGLIFRDDEEIVTTGVIVARTLLGSSLPVLRVSDEAFESLPTSKYASIFRDELLVSDRPLPLQGPPSPLSEDTALNVSLNVEDKAILNEKHGVAAANAMKILLQYAHLQGARELTPVSRAHIDACIYTGPASVLIAETFLSQGARVAVPTTLNAISIDQRRWHELCVDKQLAKQADRLAKTYIAMGAQNTFTCAPYLLASPPSQGENIGWAESNAVVFANSVLGARTQKYPDLIDVCIALTGRAPLAGAQASAGRLPSVHIHVPSRGFDALEEAFYPLLGHTIGKLVGGQIPLITGLERINHRRPSTSDLKGLCAAFATTASAPMCHIAGITPEAEGHLDPAGLKRIPLTESDLRAGLVELTNATDETVGLVSLGNPHFSLEEFARLSDLCAGRHRSASVQMIITTSRQVYAQASTAGYVGSIESFGGLILTDTCWCMMPKSMIDSSVRNLMTNSAKYAHYAPGIVNRGVHFGSLKQCVDAAVKGKVDRIYQEKV
ncbi:hypothetical protein BJX61DRAFT_339993 [Aspergillus egyptiacus]|nr:hypothetical protein BJX61DRAFT_339993 [Aspergillus egyptiacus]